MHSQLDIMTWGACCTIYVYWQSSTRCNMSKKYLGFTSYYDNEMQILFSSTNPFAFIAYVIIGGDSNPSIYITLANLPPYQNDLCPTYTLISQEF